MLVDFGRIQIISEEIEIVLYVPCRAVCLLRADEFRRRFLEER